MTSFINTQFYKLLNLGLRASGMGCKFLIGILLSKYYEDSAYKNYTLITTTITIAIYLLGVDFYNYSIRDILISKKKLNVKDKIRSTLFFYFFLYFIFFIISWFTIRTISYIKPHFVIIYLLAMTEHLSQEIYRFFIAFKEVLRANVILAFRTVSWVLIVLYHIYNNQEVSVEFILTIWFYANLITIGYVALFLFLHYFKAIITSQFRLVWIKKGIRVASVFFLGTILLKLIEYANRYIVAYFLEDQYVGIYGFYSTLAIIITIYINTIVISFELPSLIAAANTTTIEMKYAHFKKALFKQSIIVICVLLTIIYPLLKWQDKASYINHYPLFFILILAVFFMNYSLAENSKLYILHKDKIILKILIITSVFSLVSATLLTYLFGIYGTAFSFLLTAFLMFLLRNKESSKFSF